MPFPRALAALAGVAALLAACGDNSARPPASSSTPKASTPTAAPAPPLCTDPAAVPASLSPPEKLAQLLMVGVKNADDARAVVTTYHVGGIFIGSWTDLSIFD